MKMDRLVVKEFYAGFILNFVVLYSYFNFIYFTLLT